MYRHKPICKKRPQNPEESREPPEVPSDIQSSNIQSTLERLKKEMMEELRQEFKESIRHLQASSSNASVQNINSHNTTNTTNTYNIQINAYDRPNISYLTPGFLTQCVRRRDKGLCELIEHIHYHPDHIENHNIRVQNKKLNWIETHNGERFVYQDKNKVLDELIREGYEILEEHYAENEEDIQEALNHNETRLEEIREFLEKCRDQDINVIAPLKQNVYLLILNKQYILFRKN